MKLDLEEVAKAVAALKTAVYQSSDYHTSAEWSIKPKSKGAMALVVVVESTRKARLVLHYCPRRVNCQRSKSALTDE